MKKTAARFSQRITQQDLLQFFRQLSTLLSAGLSLIKSLDLLIQTQEKPNCRSLIQALRIDLESGKAFHRCLQRHPQLIDLFSCQLIRIGEHTGTLEQTLRRIVYYKEKNQALKKQIQQALIYPAVILSTALLTLGFLLLWVVPQFASFFEHFPNKLPAATRTLIKLSSAARQILAGSGWPLLLLSFTIYCFRTSLAPRKYCQHLLFKLPGLKNWIRKTILAHFSRAMANILSAGLPLTEALLLVAQLSPFDEVRKAIFKVHTGVSSGKRFSSNLKSLPFFPSLLIHMVRIGEESGTLDQMLEKFAEIYEADLERELNTLRVFLEPLIIAILGVLIGGIIIVMYLPIFRLGTAI